MAVIQGPGWYARSTATQATGTTSLSITTPSGVVDNDILICGIAHKGSDWAVMPAGWTVVDRVLQGSTRTEMHWKRASSEGASYSITGLATVAAGAIRAYGGGLLSGSVVNVSASATAAAGTSAVAASLAVTQTRALLVGIVGSGTNEPISRLTNYTTIVGDAPPDANVWSYSIRANPRTSGISCALCDTQKACAGASGLAKAELLFGNLSGENGLIVAALIPDDTTAPSVTRYYLAFKGTGTRIEGIPHGGWDATFGGPSNDSAIISPYRLSRTKSDAGRLGQTRMVSNVPESDTLVYYGISPPLEAQTIAGDVNVGCLVQQAFEDRTLGPISVDAFYKLHVYISAGQTTTVRHTLVDAYVDSAAFAFGSLTGTTFSAPHTMDSGDAEAGDCLVVELGVHVGTFATPTPLRPPQDYARVDLCLGAQNFSGFSLADSRSCFGPAFVDVVGGETRGATVDLCGWIEFDSAITEQEPATNTAPNQTAGTATAIAALPFHSAGVSTVGLTTAEVPLWWTWEADFTGTAIVHVLGTNYPVQIRVSTAPTSGTVSPERSVSETMSGPMCVSMAVVAVESGTTYYIRVREVSTSVAPSAGGLLLVSVIQSAAPAADDLFLPVAGVGILRYRENELIDVLPNALVWSGIAIDYTRRPLDVLGGGVNEADRLYVGIYPAGPVEILDMETGDEIDYISSPVPTASTSNWEDGDLWAQGQLALTPEGMLAVAWWGNGFTRVASTQGATTLTGSFLIAPATTNSAQLALIDAAHADNQPDAPFAAATRYSLAQPTAGAGYVALSADAQTVTYTSGGIYLATGAHVVKQFDLAGNAQLPDLVTLPTSGVDQPDVKGLCALPDGGWLVCNGGNIKRITSAGAVLQTYTPSSAALGSTLVDVRLTPDATAFWALDLATQSLFKFALVSGAQTYGFRTYSGRGNVTQMAIYGASTPTPTPPEPTYSIRRVSRVRCRRAPHLSDEQRLFFYHAIQIDLQAGIGLPTGQGSDPLVMLRYSDDGGHTWSQVITVSAGRQGQYKARAIFRRLGRSRDRVFEVRVSDPVTWALLDAILEGERGTN